MKRLVVFTAIFLLSAAGIATSAGDQHPQVGIVVHLNAPSDRYLLMREEDGKRVEEKIDVLIPLYENDVLWIRGQRKPKDAAKDLESGEISVTLQLADGEKVLTSKDSPYRMERKPPLSVFSNFTGPLQDLIHSLFLGLNDDYHRAKLTSLAVRGHEGHLFMPLIGRSGALLAAGARDLHLAWRGGYPPYVLRIRSEKAEKPLAEMSGLHEAHVHLKGLALGPGDYVLEIKDTRGQHLTRNFQAVPPISLPPLPNQAFSEARSKAEIRLRETVYAAWLTEQDPVLWSLEAYQRMADIAPEFYPAELLRLRLEGEL